MASFHCLFSTTRRYHADGKIATENRSPQNNAGKSTPTGGIRGTECLTEAWVSGQRFGWIDLQAGPFEWGPVRPGGAYKSPTSEIIPHRPRSQQKKSASPRGRWSDEDDTRKYADRVKRLRKKIEERNSDLGALATQMKCGGVDNKSKHDGNAGGERRSNLGVAAAAACDEITSQRNYLRKFQKQEASLFNGRGRGVS